MKGKNIKTKIYDEHYYVKLKIDKNMYNNRYINI